MEQVKKLQYNVIFRPEPEGGYTVLVPSLPGCITYGKNLTEAKAMAKDAISAYISVLVEDNEPIPTDEKSVVSSIPFSLKNNLVHA